VDDTEYTWYKITTNLNLTGYVASLKNGNWIEVISTPPVQVVDQPPVENKTPRLIFECKKEGLYAIRLNVGEKLYLE
jgi:hypothetical protein